MDQFKDYTIAVDGKQHKEIIKNYFKYIGGKDRNGNLIDLNNVHYEKNGKPWFPLMGEFHFARCDQRYWKEFLLKMKAGGLSIVAVNIFWIFHEEEEEQWNWEGSNNLNGFMKLCRELDIYVFLRIGPWGHGEVRNGGFPYWLLEKCKAVRENNPEYLKYVEKFFRQIYEQVKGFFFKDNGPVIGVQVENEYGHCGGAEGSVEHLLTLKKLILEIGYDVPLYTITGWGGAKIPDDELLPVLSNYSTHPWAEGTFKLPLFVEFLFRKASGDVINYTGPETHRLVKSAFNPDKYPFTMCEMGGGICLTYTRRPLLKPKDVTANIFVQLGSGAVFLGYYMFCGGINPKGRSGYLNESKDAGEWTTVPKLNYDFQAPVKMYGQIGDSYKYLKILHYFINDFSEKLPVMQTAFPDNGCRNPGDRKTLRYAVRSHEDKGFIFFNNYQRGLDMEDINAEVTVKLKDQVINFGKFTLKKECYFFWPFNMELEDIILISAKAQPVCILNNPDSTTFVFLKCPDVQPVLTFDRNTIETINAETGGIETAADFIVYKSGADSDDLIKLKSKSKKPVEILLLRNQHELKIWKFNDADRQRLIITDSILIFEERKITCTNRKPKESFLIYPDKGINFFSCGKKMLFNKESFYSKLLLVKSRKSVKYNFKKIIASRDMNIWSVKFYKDLFDDDENINDIYLRINPACNTAEVYIDRKMIMDYFYNGEVLEIGLKRYREALVKKREIIIKLFPLTKDDDICFDMQPDFKNGIACEIKNLELVPEYKTVISSG